MDESTYSTDSSQSGRKRNVEDALGDTKNADVSGREMYGMPILEEMEHYRGPSPSTSTAWDHAHHARMVAHHLGVDHPGAEASTSFYPGYQWWPSQLMTTEGLTHMALSAPMDLPQNPMALRAGRPTSVLINYFGFRADLTAWSNGDAIHRLTFQQR